MRGDMPPLPQYVFMVWCLFKHRDNFTFLPLLYKMEVSGQLHAPAALLPEKEHLVSIG
jgi:hypothetical protein